MQYPIEFRFGQQRGRDILDVGFDERRVRRDGLAVSGGQIVDDDDVMSSIDKYRRADTAHVAGTAGHQKSHYFISS